MKKILLNIYYWPMFIVVTILGLAVLPFILLVFAVFLGRTIDHALRWGISIYGWMLVCMVPFFAPARVEYRAGKFPKPCILVANHTSAIDPYLFGALLINACFVTSWPFKIPVYGPLMRLAGYISAHEGWERISQRGTELLKSGVSLIMWPEGHRSRDGRLGRFKKGAFALSMETGYPVVPVCILGAGKFMAPGRRSISPSRIKLVLLDPIYPSGHGDRQLEITAMRDKTRQAIQKILRENN